MVGGAAIRRRTISLGGRPVPADFAMAPSYSRGRAEADGPAVPAGAGVLASLPRSDDARQSLLWPAHPRDGVAEQVAQPIRRHGRG